MLPFSGCVRFGGGLRQRQRQRQRQWRSVASSETVMVVNIVHSDNGLAISVAEARTNDPSDRECPRLARRPHPDRELSAEDMSLLAALDTSCTRHKRLGRFLTMQRRRRKRLVTRQLVTQRALLDDISHGHTELALRRIGNWDFNAFTFDTVTGGRSVPVLCTHLLTHLGVINHFQLDAVRVWKFFCLIEKGYHNSNPYHNSVHATDVTQAMFCFLREPKIREHLLPIEVLSAIVGAVAHDLDHPGVNQPFLIATSNHLATLYRNASVLENHHWRMTCGCLAESGLLAAFSRHHFDQLVSIMRSLILATDIARQSEFISQFKHYVSTNSLDLSRTEQRHFILQMALKCADISNPCRPWLISQKWSKKVCDEFYRQGDYERRLRLPLTTLCDRVSSSVAKIQVGFFRHVVRPLYADWNSWMRTPLATQMATNLDANQIRWERHLQRETEEEVRTEISDDMDALSSGFSASLADPGDTSCLVGSSFDDFDDQASLSELRELLTAPASFSRRHSAPLIVLPSRAPAVARRESMPLVLVSDRGGASAARRAATDSTRQGDHSSGSGPAAHPARGRGVSVSSRPSLLQPTRCVRLSEENEEDCEVESLKSGPNLHWTPTARASVDLSTDLLLPELSIASITSSNSPSPISGSGWTPAPSPSPILSNRTSGDSADSSDTPSWLPVLPASALAGCQSYSRRLSQPAVTQSHTVSAQWSGAESGRSQTHQQQQQRNVPANSLTVKPHLAARRSSAPLIHSKTSALLANFSEAGKAQLAVPVSSKRRGSLPIDNVASLMKGMHLVPKASKMADCNSTRCCVERRSLGGSHARTGGWRSSQSTSSVAHHQMAKLRLALLLRLKAALSMDADTPPPAALSNRRCSLPTDLITICSPR